MKKENALTSVLLAVLLLVNLCAICILIRRGMYAQASDFKGQWTFCAYTLRGIDPLALIGTTVSPIEKIGTVPAGFNTSPWGLFLGNFFYPGYLSKEVAGIYLIILNIIITTLFAMYVFKKFCTVQKTFTFFAVAFTVFMQNEWSAVYSGNAGGVMALLLVFACLSGDDYPILSGIALSLAMTKPQLAVPFGFAFLLQKRYKLITVAAVIDILSWLIAAFLTRTNPLMLLKEFVSAGVALDMEFMGIFSPVFYWFTGSTKGALLISMIFGLAFVAVFHFLQKSKPVPHNSFFTFYPACFATVFWCYTRGYDRAVLLIPALFCAMQVIESKTVLQKIIWFSASAFCLWERLIITVIYKGMAKILYAGVILSPKDNRLKLCNTFSTSLYAVFLIIIACIILKAAKQNSYEANHPRT